MGRVWQQVVDPNGDGSTDDGIQYPLDSVADLFGIINIVENDKEGRGCADDSRRHVQDIADRDQDDDSDNRSEEIHRKIQSQKIFDGYQGDPEYTGDSIASDTTDSMMEGLRAIFTQSKDRSQSGQHRRTSVQ